MYEKIKGKEIECVKQGDQEEFSEDEEEIIDEEEDEEDMEIEK